jgi:hypothetical protein
LSLLERHSLQRATLRLVLAPGTAQHDRVRQDCGPSQHDFGLANNVVHGTWPAAGVSVRSSRRSMRSRRSSTRSIWFRCVLRSWSMTRLRDLQFFHILARAVAGKSAANQRSSMHIHARHAASPERSPCPGADPARNQRPANVGLDEAVQG